MRERGGGEGEPDEPDVGGSEPDEPCERATAVRRTAGHIRPPQKLDDTNGVICQIKEYTQKPQLDCDKHTALFRRSARRPHISPQRNLSRLAQSGHPSAPKAAQLPALNVALEARCRAALSNEGRATLNRRRADTELLSRVALARRGRGDDSATARARGWTLKVVPPSVFAAPRNLWVIGAMSGSALQRVAVPCSALQCAARGTLIAVKPWRGAARRAACPLVALGAPPRCPLLPRVAAPAGPPGGPPGL